MPETHGAPASPSKSLRPVSLAGMALFCPAGIGVAGAKGGTPGPVPGFKAQNWIPDRKGIKLMGRGVQLGVAAVREALSQVEGWEKIPPERRALFVGATPQAGDPEDLRPALAAGTLESGEFDLDQFAREGIDLIHPLWLVKGLSNNVLGFASAAHDMQGTNANWCDGEEGGWTAIVEGWDAVAEGRADIAVAGGADALVGAEAIFGGTVCGEGAAMVVWRVAEVEEDGYPRPSRERLPLEIEQLGHLGAASWPIAWVRAQLQRR